MKKIASYLAILTLFLNASPLIFADETFFTDVQPGHPTLIPINYVKAMGIVDGHPDGSYRPYEMINRAEFTKIITNSVFSEEEVENCTESVFPDVEPGVDWFAPYICIAEQNEIVKGYNDGTFKPTEEISVVEAAKIITLGFGYEAEEGNPWYKNYILALDEEQALPPTFTSFTQSVNREEMARIIFRLKNGINSSQYATYESLGGDVIPEENDQENSAENEGNATTLPLSDIRDCDKVAAVEFVIDDQNSVQYGAFTWTGQILSFEEVDGTHLRLEVADDGSVAFNFFKEQALKMNNEGPNRYSDEMLYFALGSLDEEGQLATVVQSIDEGVKNLIVEKADSSELVTLSFAKRFSADGGVGNYQMTFACSIEAI